MSLNSSEIYEFGDYRLDVDERTIERLNGGQLDALPTKTFDVLVLLVRRRGRLVSKDELLEQVWPDTIVEANNLEKRVHRLRRFLGETDSGSKHIETVRGHGYRFVAPVHKLELTDSRLDGSSIATASPGASPDLLSGAANGDVLRQTYETGKNAPWDRRPVFFASACVALLAVLVAGWYWRSTLAVRQPQLKSLAVLPFENGSGDAKVNYLSDGLSESLIDKLSQLRQLKVTARTSSFKFRGKNPDFQEIAAKLGVQAVMTGKVAKIGDQLHIRVELVDTSENTQIWGDQFIRPYAQVTNIQHEIAQIVSDKMRLELTGAQETRLSKTMGTDSTKAYELYLKAGHLTNVNESTENKRSAIRLLQQAVEVDPNFARAWAGLADLNFALVGIGTTPRAEGERTAEAALKKALELDPDLPAARLTLASSKNIVISMARG